MINIILRATRPFDEEPFVMTSKGVKFVFSELSEEKSQALANLKNLSSPISVNDLNLNDESLTITLFDDSVTEDKIKSSIVL